MKTKNMPSSIFLCSLLLLAVPRLLHADSVPKNSRPNIYDEAADGSKQVATALQTAKKEKKHVLLQFGANWCGWCHKLHQLCESDKGIGGKLKNDFVVVMVELKKE